MLLVNRSLPKYQGFLYHLVLAIYRCYRVGFIMIIHSRFSQQFRHAVPMIKLLFRVTLGSLELI